MNDAERIAKVEAILAEPSNREKLKWAGFNNEDIDAIAEDGAKPELLEAVCKADGFLRRMKGDGFDHGFLWELMTNAASPEHIKFIDDYAGEVLGSMGMARTFGINNYPHFLERTKQTHDYDRDTIVNEIFLGIAIEGDLEALQAGMEARSFSRKFNKPASSQRARLEEHEEHQERRGRR